MKQQQMEQAHLDIVTRFLEKEFAPGIYLLPDDNFHYFHIQQLFRPKGWSFAHLNGTEIERRNEFMYSISEALNLPKKWEWTWDELHRLLSDLSWHKDAAGFIIQYDRFHRYAYTDWDSFINAYDILWDMVAHWSETETPLYVLLQGDEDSLPQNFPELQRITIPEDA